jgi:hypothetical protein
LDVGGDGCRHAGGCCGVRQVARMSFLRLGKVGCVPRQPFPLRASVLSLLFVCSEFDPTAATACTLLHAEMSLAVLSGVPTAWVG